MNWNPITAVVEAASRGYASYQERKTKVEEVKNAVDQRRVDLLKSEGGWGHTWELAALAGDSWECALIRFGIYLEVSAGIIITVVNPEQGARVWESMLLVPDWILGIHLTIAGWGFGSQPLKATAAGLVGSVFKFEKKGAGE